MNKFTIVIITAICVVVSACSKRSQNLEYGLKLSETLRINITTEPPSLDWAKSSDTTSALIQDNIMEGLVEYDFTSPEISLKPALATGWEGTKKATHWEFDLRKDVKWTDGTLFTGQHVIDGWERLLNPKTASQYAYFLFNVKNAKEYNAGKVKDFSKVGVKFKDGKLIVDLVSPQSYFPYLLTHHSTYPVRKDVVEKSGDRWTEPENIQTLGAYKLKIWKHDANIVLERNESYYGEKPAIKNILAYMIGEHSTALNMFDAKKVDSLHSLPSTEMSHLRQRSEYKEAGLLGIYYYGFNVNKAPMDNVLVRKAINHAIDRKEITKMLAGGQKPMSGWVPPGMFGFEEGMGLEFDAAKAKEFLKKAGYADPKKFPKITIGFNTNEDHQRVAENVQAQLRRNLGINIELENSEWKVYLGKVKQDPPHIFRMGWIADYPDPENFLTLMTSSSDNNYTGWKEPKFDKLIEKALTLASKDERGKIYASAQSMLTEAAVPVAPIYSYVGQIMVSKRVLGYPVNAMNRFIYKDVKLKK